MTLLDTSILVEALGAGGRMRAPFRRALERGERMAIPSLVLHEWLSGPRLPEELAAQEALFPSGEAPAFGPDEARIAARLQRELGFADRRRLDLAVAACAISWDATLWTLEADDYSGIPGLRVRAG